MRWLGIPAVIAIVLGRCGFPEAATDRGSARLTARPASPTQTCSPGLRAVTLPGNSARNAWLYVPASYQPARPMPLVVALHGAGGVAQGPVTLLSAYAEESGFLLIAPESLGSTWDAIYALFGPDLATIDALLRYAFDHCAVDPARLVLEGFSDGASYALAVGLANGDLFSRIIAFSPGFIPETSSPSLGHPEFFFSHGREDPILPIDGASRFLVSSLENAGYEVTYIEFDGGHTVPTEIVRQAVAWLMR